jgi:hypothetical protein
MAKKVYANPLTSDNPTGVGLDPTNSYRFRIGAQESAWQSSRAVKLEDILGVTPNASTSYNIEVQTTYNGTIQSYGSACLVTTPASIILIDNHESTPDRNIIQDNMVEVFPNPSSDYFIVKPESKFEGNKIQIRLYDLQGSLLSIHDHERYADNVSEVIFGSDLPKGVYYIHVYSDKGFLESIQLVKL